MVQQLVVNQGLLNIQASRQYSDTTLGRTPLNEWSAWRRELYLTAYNILKRHAPTLPVGFEPAIPGNERPQPHALKARPLSSAYEIS